jgi:hypothetical protein
VTNPYQPPGAQSPPKRGSWSNAIPVVLGLLLTVIVVLLLSLSIVAMVLAD